QSQKLLSEPRLVVRNSREATVRRSLPCHSLVLRATADFGGLTRIISMRTSTGRINELILEQLTGGERRLLSLTVAVGNVLRRSETVKGDLGAMVRCELRRLVD